MAYNMKRGNKGVPFSELGSSPAKHDDSPKGLSKDAHKQWHESDEHDKLAIEEGGTIEEQEEKRKKAKKDGTIRTVKP